MLQSSKKMKEKVGVGRMVASLQKLTISNGIPDYRQPNGNPNMVHLLLRKCYCSLTWSKTILADHRTHVSKK